MAFSNLIEYFEDLATANIAINGSFIHGPTDRIIGSQRDDLTFPVLYLEYPELKEQQVEEYVTTLYTDKRDELKNIKNITQQSWNRIEDEILNEFSNI
jgi:hypothetical protein